MKRTITRAATRRRQTWLDLPASGIEEVGHGQEQRGTLGENRGEEEEPRRSRGWFHTLPATRQALAELMAWSGIEEPGKAMTLMIHHLHRLGPGGALPLLTPPRHEYVIPENVSRKLKLAHDREALHINHDE